MDVIDAMQIEEGDIIATGDDFLTVENVEDNGDQIYVTGFFYNSETAFTDEYSAFSKVNIVTDPEEME